MTGVQTCALPILSGFEQLKIGDRVQVLNGAQIPTDGVVIEGSTAVDESSINGEKIGRASCRERV